MTILRRALLGLYVKYLLYAYDLPNWSFGFKRMFAAGGYTDYETKTITFSSVAVERLPARDLRELAIHEVAHALTPEAVTHDEVWCAKSKSMGGSGGIYTPNFSTDSDYKWLLCCPACEYQQHIHIKYHLWCPNCGTCAKYKLNN